MEHQADHRQRDHRLGDLRQFLIWDWGHETRLEICEIRARRRRHPCAPLPKPGFRVILWNQ